MRVRRSFAVVLGAWWSVAFGVSAAPAGGVLAEERAARAAPEARPRAPIGPEEWKRRLRAAVADLSSSDVAQLEQALHTLRELGGRDAAQAVMARVRLGLPPHLTELAVEVLSELNQPITTPVLVELTLHRRWQVRHKAARALGALRVRSTVSVLLYALDDPSAEVRGAAALSLGQVGDKRALPALAAALEKGVPEALFALAQLGSAQHVKLIVAHAQNDLKASEPALRTVLKRPNLPVASKLLLVNTLKGLATPEAAALLESLRASLGKGTEPQLVAALADVGNQS